MVRRGTGMENPRRSALRRLRAPALSTAVVAATTLHGNVHLVEAVLPTGELRLSGGDTAYAAPAWFGLQLPEEEEASYLPLRVPQGSADGCGVVMVEDPPADGFVLLVERGNCFFDEKALAAQEAGAEGLVVMNSVEGIYQVSLSQIVQFARRYRRQSVSAFKSGRLV